MADISRSEMSDGSDCAEAFVFDAAEAGRPEDDDDEACIPLVSLFSQNVRAAK